MAIPIRGLKEIEELKQASFIAARAPEYASSLLAPGVSTLEVANKTEEFIIKSGARASFKGLYGFSGSICVSVNEVIIHGIPSNATLNEGDIVGVDVGVEFNGWYGDVAATYAVGEVSVGDKKLIDCAKDSLEHAISSIKEGMRFKELSAIIERFIIARGYKPLKNFCGHGIGRKPHEEPQILNYVDGASNQGPKIKNGMVFCIEPMICSKDGEAVVLDDKWSVVSKDGLRGSHYEHTVAIINGRAVVLTI